MASSITGTMAAWTAESQKCPICRNITWATFIASTPPMALPSARSAMPSAGDVRDTDDLASRVGEHPRGDRADISEALYDHARSRRRHTHALHLIERAERDPPSGRLDAAVRPADLDRFRGH